MAESQANQTTEPLAHKDGGEKHLKYLGFVQYTVIYFVVCFSTVYDYAKENAGPLKPGAQTVENIVKTIIRPIYERFHGVPMEVLMFFDLKVAEALTILNRHVPAQNLPEATRELASKGLETATKVTKELYQTYEPVAEKYAVSAWRSMHKLPLFPQVVQIAVPTATFFLEKYNYTVCYTAGKGYLVAQYLPLVPIDKIAKVFSEGEDGPTVGQSVPVET